MGDTTEVKTKKRKRPILGFQVSDVLYDRLKDMAWQKRMTLSQLCRSYVIDGLNNKAKQD